MRRELLTYYERELTFLREMTEEFSKKHPDQAGRLKLEPSVSRDPHVERMIEACALLAARVQLKLDDDFPEITEALLQVLYPHYLAPTPSMSIVEFAVDPERGKLTSAHTIRRHTLLDTNSSAEGTCRFRTCYPTVLWPLTVVEARLEPALVDGLGRAAPAIVIRIKASPDVLLPDLKIESLRFFLAGEDRLASRIYEAIMTRCDRVELRAPDGTSARAPLVLPPSAIQEVGFGPDEGMLPYSHRSFLGYRLLQEFFHFPQKFRFFDLCGLSALEGTRFTNEASIVLFLSAPPRFERVRAENFRLRCTPVVNLFPAGAQPLTLTQARPDQRIVPAHNPKRAAEVYAVDKVSSVSTTGKVTEYYPFYSFKHAADRQQHRTFWHATRRASEVSGDPGTEVYLSLVDLDFRPTVPGTDTLIVDATWTNRDLPARLRFMAPGGDFQLVDASASVQQISCLMRPTASLRPPVRHGLQWRLISHLSLNYLSAVEAGPNGEPEVLREILRLYDFSDRATQHQQTAIDRQISSLVRVHSKHVTERIRTEHGVGFARGIRATLTFDEERVDAADTYLFASVLEKFLGLYVSINSFSQMVAENTNKDVIKKWPPRSGQQVLL